VLEIDDDKLMLTRNGKFLQINGKFPRLKGKSPAKRLASALDLAGTL